MDCNWLWIVERSWKSFFWTVFFTANCYTNVSYWPLKFLTTQPAAIPRMQLYGQKKIFSTDSSSKPTSVTQPHFSTETEPGHSTEHSSIQKGSVQCIEGASNIGRLLSAVWGSDSVHTYLKRNAFIGLLCSAIYCYFSVSKLVFKPAALIYCWKIRQVRKAVKETLRQLFCLSSYLSIPLILCFR